MNFGPLRPDQQAAEAQKVSSSFIDSHPGYVSLVGMMRIHSRLEKRPDIEDDVKTSILHKLSLITIAAIQREYVEGILKAMDTIDEKHGEGTADSLGLGRFLQSAYAVSSEIHNTNGPILANMLRALNLITEEEIGRK